MKTFTQFYEGVVTADVNPGNSVNLGVTNHYTPIENIVTNIKNLYATRLGVVATTGEDNVSIKLHSSKFTDKDSINKVLWEPLDTGVSKLTLDSYIRMQGLNVVKMINVGQYFVVYYCPDDIKAQDPVKNPLAGQLAPEVPDTLTGVEVPQVDVPCEEMQKDCFNYEIEMQNLFEDYDEEIKDVTKLKIQVLINSKDKVKAAKSLEQLISQELDLPRDFYFAGVKSKDGEESIALRWRYSAARPHGNSEDSVRSLINIFSSGHEGVWVGDYAKDSLFKLPSKVKEIIDDVLDLIGAEPTDDPAIFNILEEGEKDAEKDDTVDDSNDNNDDLLDNDGSEKKEDNTEEKSPETDKEVSNSPLDDEEENDGLL